jgi:transcription elongation GreA/GreB family factor
MSKAFTREDGEAAPTLPDLPLSPHPNHVTPRGLAQLQARLAEAQARLAALKARPDRLDLLPEAAAERDIRFLHARLASAILVPPPDAPPAKVTFGTEVEVEDGDGARAVYRITGEDEAEPARGLVAAVSPLGRALLGAQVGDQVIWRRPNGARTLEVIAIAAIPAGAE